MATLPVNAAKSQQQAFKQRASKSAKSCRRLEAEVPRRLSSIAVTWLSRSVVCLATVARRAAQAAHEHHNTVRQWGTLTPLSEVRAATNSICYPVARRQSSRF